MIETIRQWFGKLRPDAAHFVEEMLEYEYVIRITPKNPNATGVEFRVGDYGTFGLYFGKGFAFEDLLVSDDEVLDICESIRHGRVREKVWEWRGKVIRTEGSLFLSSGTLSDRGSNHWAGFLPIGTVRNIEYESWEV